MASPPLKISLPHGRCFIEGRFKFGDQIPLLFAKLFFSFLLWKCSLNKAKEDATEIFKPCWHVFARVAVNPFRAVGGSALTMPAPLRGSPGPDAGGTRQGSPSWAGGCRNWVGGTDGRTDRQRKDWDPSSCMGCGDTGAAQLLLNQKAPGLLSSRPTLPS